MYYILLKIKYEHYGTRIFINGIELTRSQYPQGFTASIDVYPTVVYWYEGDENNIEINIKWSNSTFDPRLNNGNY